MEGAAQRLKKVIFALARILPFFATIKQVFAMKMYVLPSLVLLLLYVLFTMNLTMTESAKLAYNIPLSISNTEQA